MRGQTGILDNRHSGAVHWLRVPSDNVQSFKCQPMPIDTKTRMSLWLPPLVYMVAIFHFSSETNPLPQVTAHVWDKLLHTLEYSGLAVLLCRALIGEGAGWIRAIVLAIVVSSIYGASDEWHQSFVPLRDSDVRDWLTDNIGATLGAGCYAAFGRRRQESEAAVQGAALDSGGGAPGNRGDIRW
jgi:VanZ family protein